MIKSALFALMTGAAALGATSAHAGGVSWSIGINVPVFGAVVSNAPDYYYDGPGYSQAPVYAPAPYYRAAPRVIHQPRYEPRYEPRPIYYRPAPVVVQPHYHGGRDGSRWHQRRDHGGWGERHHRGDRDHDGYRDGRGGR